LECKECKSRNYTTTRNKRKQTEKFKMKKYCRFCRRHTDHKESK